MRDQPPTVTLPPDVTGEASEIHWTETGRLFARTDDIDATPVNIAGAAGQPHHDFLDAGHFIQKDAGPERAQRMADWMTQ